MLFEGPRRYIDRAKYELENEEAKLSDEVWVKMLKKMYNQRDYYDSMVTYSDENPIYSALLNIYEDTRSTAVKPLLEAFLITELTFQQISERLIHLNPLYNPLFIGLYHDLFYNIRPYINSDVAMYKYIVQPMLTYGGSNLAMEHIWKLLAYRGGAKLLTDVGIGAKPFTPDDIDYLLHLSSMRSATTMLSYVSKGMDAFSEEAQGTAANVLGVIYKYEASRSIDRDEQGFRAIVDTSATEFSSALTSVFKKLVHSEPTEEKLLADGKFDVNNKDAIEECYI